MLDRILNKIGYYKMDQLDIGGWCGCCGEHMPEEIFPKHWVRDIFSRSSICQKCRQ